MQYLSNESGSYSYPSIDLAVRPALHTFTSPNRFTNLILCGIIGSRVKDLNLLGCVPAGEMRILTLTYLEMAVILLRLMRLTLRCGLRFTFTPPNRFTKPHTLRYNRAKGKRSKLAWLRTGGVINGAFRVQYLSNESGSYSYPSIDLAVRPALHTFTSPNRFTNLIALRYNCKKVKRLIFAWLRTGDGHVGYDGYWLSGSGAYLDCATATLLAVRPALYSPDRK